MQRKLYLPRLCHLWHLWMRGRLGGGALRDQRGLQRLPCGRRGMLARGRARHEPMRRYASAGDRRQRGARPAARLRGGGYRGGGHGGYGRSLALPLRGAGSVDRATLRAVRAGCRPDGRPGLHQRRPLGVFLVGCECGGRCGVVLVRRKDGGRDRARNPPAVPCSRAAGTPEAVRGTARASREVR